jgi:hypothetical protein
MYAKPYAAVPLLLRKALNREVLHMSESIQTSPFAAESRIRIKHSPVDFETSVPSVDHLSGKKVLCGLESNKLGVRSISVPTPFSLIVQPDAKQILPVQCCPVIL